MKEWDVVVLGGANTDYLVRGQKLPAPGETVAGDTFQQAPGGKGANQAVAAARLGARVALVARVGADERGEEILARLAAEGVDTKQIVRDPTAPTGVALVQVDAEGQKQIQVAPGANHQLTVLDVISARSVLGAASVLLCQLEVPIKCVMATMRLVKEANAKVVLDAAPPTSLPDEVIGMVDVLRANEGEAEALTGVRVRDRASSRQAARRLLERGALAAVLAAGHEGNLLVWREAEVWLPRLPVNSIDTTGAGDAFAAALAVMLAEGRTLAEAGAFANAAAAMATTVLGAQAGLPKREEVMKLLDQSR